MKKTINSALEELLFSFRKKLLELSKEEAKGLKIPISHIDTLLYISEKENPSMKEIANHLNITPPSATAIIESLQKKKLICRLSSENDRRIIKINLTSKAWKLIKSLHGSKVNIIKKMFSKLQPVEQKQFINILTILTKD